MRKWNTRCSHSSIFACFNLHVIQQQGFHDFFFRVWISRIILFTKILWPAQRFDWKFLPSFRVAIFATIWIRKLLQVQFFCDPFQNHKLQKPEILPTKMFSEVLNENARRAHISITAALLCYSKHIRAREGHLSTTTATWHLQVSAQLNEHGMKTIQDCEWNFRLTRTSLHAWERTNTRWSGV